MLKELEKRQQDFRVRKERPKLREFLATRAVLHYYEEDTEVAEEKRMLDLCERELSSENKTRLYLRLMKEYNNDRIVEAVLNEAGKVERQFFHDKYKENLPIVNIGMKLHASPATLLYWQNAMLAEIASLMFYQLPPKDVFSISIVSTLVSIIRQMVNFLRQYDTGEMDRSTLRELEQRGIVYHNILLALERCSLDDAGDVMSRVVKARMADRAASIDSLARMLGLSTGMVCKQLDLFATQHFKVA